jgi:transcriptional regulator with XRE-family HTH domain
MAYAHIARDSLGMAKTAPATSSKRPHVVVGERIRALREALNPPVDQIELGRLVGVAQSTMHRYETGVNLPGADVLSKLAAALGTSERFIVTGERPRLAATLDRSTAQIAELDPVEKALTAAGEIFGAEREAELREWRDTNHAYFGPDEMAEQIRRRARGGISKIEDRSQARETSHDLMSAPHSEPKTKRFSDD